jgi:hypothetical protein
MHLQAGVGKAQGLSVEEVCLDMTGEGTRSASFRVQVIVSEWARLAHAAVIVRGRLGIGDQLDLRVSGLTASCAGLRGLVGAVAGVFVDVGSLVRERLQAWEGRSFPLAPWFPGHELRSVQVRCRASDLEVVARFGN